MVKKPGPPITPRSSAPGKNIPASEKRLGGLDKEPPKPIDEKEESASLADAPERRNDEEGEEEEDESDDEESEDEDESQMEIAQSVKSASGLFSPEGAVFLPLAILLDLISIILIIFALDDFCILDIIGIATIGAWVFYKTGVAPSAPESTVQKAEKAKDAVRQGRASGEIAEKAEKLAAKAGKYGRWLRPALCILGELIVWIGAIPFWTYLVYKTLTDND